MTTAIDRCRACGNPRLETVCDLGTQHLTGVFPASRDVPVESAPLTVVQCSGEGGCTLAQLRHTFDLSKMYGAQYGYRSGLNPSMVKHLGERVRHATDRASLQPGDVVLDIGSNDGTTLGFYPAGLVRVGIDPTAAKFREFYAPGIEIIADFFRPEKLRPYHGRAKVVTSFSMFYDLEDPTGFARGVERCLHPEGIWISEQSYLPTMLARNSFDTICHEHLEYYSLTSTMPILERAGLRIVEVEQNDVNGGSFVFVAARTGSGVSVHPSVEEHLRSEAALGLDGRGPFQRFVERVDRNRRALLEFLRAARQEGRKVCGLGASTKGNVLLQHWGLSTAEVAEIADVNPDKWGCHTPGTGIPIRPEEEVLAGNPDYLLVLPWHFRSFFVEHPRFRGRTLVFPLPEFEIVRR